MKMVIEIAANKHAFAFDFFCFSLFVAFDLGHGWII
jgi:hypothetical protein